jgi:hypothetical protein
MSIPDQQLRQELVKYGETVPPITQRNREQLRARLEVLRARPRSPIKASPTRNRTNNSTSRSPTRAHPRRGLIELSDSETETSPTVTEYRSSRSTGRGTNVQTRSVAVGRDTDRATPVSSGNVTAEVEQSLARHRREIQQLIDSAREKSRVGTSNLSSSSSSKYDLPATTPFRPNSTASRQRQPYKPDVEKGKQPSWFKRSKETIQSFWKHHNDTILNTLKSIIFGLIVGGGLIFLVVKGVELIPRQQGKFIDYFKS